MAAFVLVLAIAHTLVYSTSWKKAFFVFIVYSYSFLSFLYNLSHRLTELNVSLFAVIKLISFKIYIMKTTTC